MSHQTDVPPSRRRLWSVFRALGSLPAIPAWLIFGSRLHTLLELAHLAYFLEEIRRRTHVDPVAFFRNWGWLVGIVWLGVVVYRAAARLEAADVVTKKQAQAFTYLQTALTHFALTLAADQEASVFTQAQQEALRKAREDFRNARRALASAFFGTLPEELRIRYAEVVLSAFADLSQFHGDRESAIEILRDILPVIKKPEQS